MSRRDALVAIVAVEAADSAEFVGFRTPIPVIHRLARIVAALPLHQFMPLNDALAKAKRRLGSGDLAARDLTQHARDRRLTIAARRILPDGTEQVFLLRSAFWQHFVILPMSIREAAEVQGRDSVTGWLTGPGRWWPGRWHFFVGHHHRRFDRLYSTADDRRAAKEKSSSDPPRPGSAGFWIDVVAPKGAWRNLTGKRLHGLAAKHIDGLNVENEREAKKQSQKPPPKINCPGVRAFQTEVANRHRRERQGQAQ